MNTLFLRVVVTVSLLVSGSFGQEGSEKQDVDEGEDSEEVFERIDIGSHWLYGQVFMVGDRRVAGGDLKALILKIDDEEASGHVRRSELYRAGALGTFALGIGLILIAGLNMEPLDMLMVSGGGLPLNAMFWCGCGALGGSALMNMQDEREIRMAVLRYNIVLEEKHGS